MFFGVSLLVKNFIVESKDSITTGGGFALPDFSRKDFQPLDVIELCFFTVSMASQRDF